MLRNAVVNESSGQCFQCLSGSSPRRESVTSVFKGTTGKEDPLHCSTWPVFPGLQDCHGKAGSGISRDSPSCFTDLVLTPKRTTIKGVLNW